MQESCGVRNSVNNYVIIRAPTYIHGEGRFTFVRTTGILEFSIVVLRNQYQRMVIGFYERFDVAQNICACIDV